MSDDGDTEDQPFRRGAIRPVKCIQDGWALVRDDYWTYFGISVVGILLGSLAPLNILLGPALCGIYYCTLRGIDGRRVSFDMLFRGFDYFMPSLIATAWILLLTIVFFIPSVVGFVVAILASAPPQPGPGVPLNQPPTMPLIVPVVFVMSIAWMMVVGLVIGSLYYFSFPLIVDRGMDGTQATVTATRAILGNIGGVLGLMVLSTLMLFVGVLACYFGVFFVLPVIFAAFTVAYRQVFSPNYEYDPTEHESEPIDPV